MPLDQTANNTRSYGPLVVVLVILLLLGLPFAAWLDMRALSERILSRQASEIGRVIDDMRGFYASDVVGRLANHPMAIPTNTYKSVDGGIPIPATLSIELGKMISARNAAVKYRFVSDYPFRGRESHNLDGWETSALASLRADPKTPVVEISGSIFDREIRMAGPVLMGAACVNCHNTHPDSPKRDWKVGDVRAIQEISIQQPIAANILSFKYLLAYLILAAIAGLTFILVQRKQAAAIAGMNKELAESNDFLASISMKIAKYLSPQIYKSIFSGQRDVAISTERKKLTIFFSDIKDFTSTTERLQPEDLTALLNEYFTEMSAIALRHGATVDKFIGDAMLLFFGDPETKGVTEDARACLLMAVDMQRRLSQLNAEWRKRGIEQPFRARMGINTGFCNVGNFGSNDRMDYTIIGAEANLAARLQSIARPGQIVLSYETYALVRGDVVAHELAPITMKGISRQVVPYAVDRVLDEGGGKRDIVVERMAGLDLYFNPGAVAPADAERVKSILAEAMASLEAGQAKPA